MSMESTALHVLDTDVKSDTNATSVRSDEHFFSMSTNDGVPPPLDVVERAYVARVLEHTAGRRLAAAQLLGISYPTFLKRLRELGFDRAVPRTGRISAV